VGDGNVIEKTPIDITSTRSATSGLIEYMDSELVPLQR